MFEFTVYSSLAGSKAKVGSKKHFVSILDLFIMQHIRFLKADGSFFSLKASSKTIKKKNEIIICISRLE